MCERGAFPGGIQRRWYRSPTLRGRLIDIAFEGEDDWLENKHLEPDVKIMNGPASVAGGTVVPLEKAIEIMLADLDTAKHIEEE